jgi:hypothetical protein
MSNCNHDRLLMPSADHPGKMYCRGCEKRFILTEWKKDTKRPSKIIEERARIEFGRRAASTEEGLTLEAAYIVSIGCEVREIKRYIDSQAGFPNAE